MSEQFSAFLEVRVVPGDAAHVAAILRSAGIDIEIVGETDADVVFRMLSDHDDDSVSAWIERVARAAPPELIWRIKDETAPGRSLRLSVLLLDWVGEPLALSAPAMEYLREALLGLELTVT